MNKGGQTAFETLFLFVILVSATIMILSVYLSINDDTNALAITRAEINEQIATKHDNIQILKIEISKNVNDTNILIKLSQPTELDITKIKQSILAKTSLKDVNIIIN